MPVLPSQKKEFSEIVLSTIKEGVDIIDEKARILFMNKHLLDKFGRKALGKKCYEVYLDDKKQCEKYPLKKSIKIGETKTNVVEGIAG
jgi:nitrogen fixation/metabolism regulation signal transduction histidine kinase